MKGVAGAEVGGSQRDYKTSPASSLQTEPNGALKERVNHQI